MVVACGPAGNSRSGMQQPLTSFHQSLKSQVSTLSLHTSEETKVPVQIENPGTETWVSAGRYPVTISYKWYKGAEMLPIEGERTMLPAVVEPKQSVHADVRVVAPTDPGDYSVRISLVQEGVAWFMTKSSSHLELRATVR
jgi:uncharacterized membrane protein